MVGLASAMCVGDVAQMGEHLLCKQGVSGSIPLISTKGSRVGFALECLAREYFGAGIL